MVRAEDNWGEREKDGKRVYFLGVAASALTIAAGTLICRYFSRKKFQQM